MGRSFSDATGIFADRMQQRRQLQQEQEQKNYDQMLKEAELQTKGITIGTQQVKRKPLLGFIPQPSGTRSFVNYDPTMNPEYQKQQLNSDKVQSEIQKNNALTELAKAKAKSQGKDDNLTIGQRTMKTKDTSSLIASKELNDVKRRSLADARSALPNVPQGLMGKLKVEYAKRFNPNDPMLADWQKIKMIGTDAQLMNTAKTKGAISDQEMTLFAQAAANDDIMSTPRLKPVLDKLEAVINAEESGMFGAYERNYGEDPRGWFKGQTDEGNQGGVPQWASSDPEAYKDAKNSGQFSEDQIKDWFVRNGLVKP